MSQTPLVGARHLPLATSRLSLEAVSRGCLSRHASALFSPHPCLPLSLVITTPIPSLAAALLQSVGGISMALFLLLLFPLALGCKVLYSWLGLEFRPSQRHAPRHSHTAHITHTPHTHAAHRHSTSTQHAAHAAPPMHMPPHPCTCRPNHAHAAPPMYMPWDMPFFRGSTVDACRY